MCFAGRSIKPGMAVNSVFLFCSAFVLFDVRGLFVFKRSEVGFCSVVLLGPLALFGNFVRLFCFCSAEVWKTFLFCERCSVPSLVRRAAPARGRPPRTVRGPLPAAYCPGTTKHKYYQP